MYDFHDGLAWIAELYEVKMKRLNEHVKRNRERFIAPLDPGALGPSKA